MATLDNEHFEFSRFRLLPRQRTLTFDENPVSVGSRGFEILRTLVSRAGSVVSAGELIEAAWPNVTVDEANLRVQIAALRKVLARCEVTARAIETVPLRGYCFVLPTCEARSSQRLPAGVLPARFPRLLSPVIGREDVVADLSQAVAERRLVSVTGPGGIGKTTAAVATASELVRSFEGGIVYADFSAVSCRAGIVATLGRGLGSDKQTFDDLVADLAAAPLLLVLDTCEHLVDEIACLAEHLLGSCPDLRVLACTREILRATGERSYQIPSLRFPRPGDDLAPGTVATQTAITLFAERAGLVVDDLATGDLVLIAEICRRLDGIPLAIEFAAARVADLGLREIAANLDDGFSILTRGKRTALPRHRTLHAALAWSYGLLTPEERELLHLLCTLSGPFTMTEAVEVGRRAGQTDVPDLLSALFEKSLVSADGIPGARRYRMLDTTRSFVNATHSGTERGVPALP